MRGGRKLKAVIPGGVSVPVVPGEIMLKTNMDYDSVKAAGSALGTGAVIVMDETTCMVRVLERISRFYMSESCGQCTPCREGTGWMNRLLKRVLAGAVAARGARRCCSMWPTASRGTPSAPSAMPRRGRCRASSSTTGTSSNT